jgi:hypothetical protein
VEDVKNDLPELKVKKCKQKATAKPAAKERKKIAALCLTN